MSHESKWHGLSFSKLINFKTDLMGTRERARNHRVKFAFFVFKFHEREFSNGIIALNSGREVLFVGENGSLN